MRKFTSILVVGIVLMLIAFPAFSGGQKDSAAGEKEQITMWFWGASPEYRMAFDKVLVKPYNESQDKYELVITYDNAVDQNIATALAADGGNAPDIIYGSGPAFVSQYAKAGKLENLNPYAEKFGWADRILAPIYKAGEVDGNLYSLPGGTITMGLFYNKKVLADLRSKDASLPAGPPSTLEEVEAFMDAALANGYYASVTGNKGWKPVNENYSTIFLNAIAGPDNVYKALMGELEWTDPVFEKAIAKSAEWYQKGYLAGRIQNGKLVIDYSSLNFDESCQLMSADKAAFFVGPSMVFQFMNPYFQGEKAKDLGFVVFPMDPSIQAQSYVLGTVNSFSVWAGSKNAEEAAKIIDIMMTKESVQVLSDVWPGYWALPMKEFNPDTSGYSALSKGFVKATQDMYEAVGKGNFGIHISTFFPPLTQGTMIDIDRVWLKDQTAAEFLQKVSSEFKKDVANKSLPVIPAPGN